MDLKSVKIIAVDFDGTLCENKWPEIGSANEELIEYLRDRQKNGDKLILWTCRVDDMLQKAIEWCKENELTFDAVNENLPEIIENFGSDTRKIFANEYIDDRNIWPLENGVADVLYLCDGKSCGDTCPGVECKHTSDIAHARNFIKGDYDSYWEKESEIKEPDSHEKSSMELWAEREVEIACKHEAPDRKPGEWDYGCACYESALKAFRSLCEDGHAKYRRMITVYVDITAPLYWWKEFDTYIERGWITQDEYENLNDYLYKPYEKMGGNGSAQKIMLEVNKLPIHKSTYVEEN